MEKAPVTDAEAIMAEFIRKFGSKEEAMSLLSRFSSSQAAAATPPPPTIPDESATQPSNSQAIDTQTSIGAQAESGQGSRAEEDREHTDDGGLAGILESMAVTETGTKTAAGEGMEGETPVKISEGVTPVREVLEGETPVDISEGVEGETPSKSVEGETPSKVVEGETPGKVVEGETPGKSVEGDTPGITETGVNPDATVGEDVPGITEEQTPEELEALIVDLVGESGEDDTPVDDRTTRRATRRSRMLEELDGTPRSRSLELGGTEADVSKVGEEQWAAEDFARAEEQRLAAERKRKGKSKATASSKTHKPVSSAREIIETAPEKIRVPFAKESLGPEVESETEMEEVSDQEEIPAYEKTEVWVTKKLLEAMAEFEDPKRVQAYKERGSSGKLVKSGKSYDPEAMRDIESEEEFLGYIGNIGFEWLLRHSDVEVPVALAREFFSTFKFKSTMDPDADSISFRIFNVEYEMSIREWSLRMGLFTPEEDEAGVWNERMIGPPKFTPGFKPQSAWEFVTHKRAGTFKTSQSKGFHITNHLLRFAQVYIGYNLMGTASSALTTPELYFTWCMARKVKVHLGYWLAQACHLMTSNASRHLYTCHLLGAYLQRNIVMKIGKSMPIIPMCDPPELFNVDYFFNKGLLYMDGEVISFYEIGKAEAYLKPDATVKAEGEVTAGGNEEWLQELETIRREVGEIRGGMATISASMLELKDAVAKQSEKMTDAISVMMRMVASVERRHAQAQHGGEIKSPALGRPTIPPAQGKLVRHPDPVNPADAASKKRKEFATTQSSSQTVLRSQVSIPARKPSSKQPVSEEDVPASPEKKRVKMNRPTVPPRSGSHGGQTQN